jgi:signal transduction histidine kinase
VITSHELPSRQETNMLADFIKKNHAEIIARARERVALRSAPRPTDAELKQGLPIFLDQLVKVLRVNGDGEAQMAESALKHGADLSRSGFTIAQVVHDYGDLCQTITALALEQHDAIPTEDFKTLNKCLDDAIAEAVTEYSRLREVSRDQAETERLGYLAHELRNKLNSAMLAYGILKEGQVGMGGSTGAVLDRSLRGLQDLITRSLTEVRVDSGAQHRERIDVRQLIEDVELEGSMDARARKQQLTVDSVEPGLEVDADRALLAAALTNLLTNAFKFSPTNSHISLRTSSTKDHVMFEVEDQCGGLPATNPEEMFQLWTQRHSDKRGLGMGLPLARRSVQASGGEVGVRNIPGKGCVFSIRMLRPPPQTRRNPAAVS